MSTRFAASRFRTTSWTLIARAGTDPAALSELAGQYWSPVYAYLRRTGRSVHDAADLTQGFFASAVLERGLVQRADPTLGRFRSYLIASLKRFLIDEYRRERGRDGNRPATLVPSDPEVLAALEPCNSDEPTQAFDRQWAATVLSQACRRVQEGLGRDGMHQHWTVFEARVLRPICFNAEPPAAAELLDGGRVSDRQEIYHMIRAVKRRLRREVRLIVAETVEDASEVDEELRELKQYLAVQ